MTVTSPISIEERRRRGNPGKRKQPKRPQFPVGEPTKPDDLDPIAEREWDRIVPTLITRQMLAPTDYGVLIGYCQAVALAEKARTELEAVVVKGAKGERKHPAYQVWRDSTSMAATLAKQLGLSFGDRGRMHNPETEEETGDDLLDS